ncbi:hypothetical protein BOX15_Mlig000993g2, partial [Macrostomum lignano]
HLLPVCLVMSVEYVPVAEEEGDDPIEVPTELDGSLLLTTLTAQFPGVSGLRYRNPDTGALRAVRLADGCLHRPPELISWTHTGNVVYVCTFPKDNKRKVEHDEMDNLSSKPKKADRKKCTDLIVLGLPYKITEEDLREYFGKFGELVMTQVKRDQKGSSKGYGFIRFAEYESQMECLSCPRHQIEGRWCEVKVPISQGEAPGPANVPRRVFVGRITEELTAPVLKEFFGQYGPVEEVYIPKPFRSFAFVTFGDSSVVSQLVGEDFVVNGVSVHVGHANPKQSSAQMMGGGPFKQGYPAQMGPPRGWQPMSGPPPPQPAGQYQEMVNTLATNPQILAAALAQVSNMSMDSGTQQQPRGAAGRGGYGGGGGRGAAGGSSASAGGDANGSYAGGGGYANYW